MDFFYNTFNAVMGKSLMFIVKKDAHYPDFIENCFEVLRVSDHQAVIKHFAGKGVVNTPAKVG
jgi:hypothetical protein